MKIMRPCPCGSALESRWLNDAAGIPLCRVCDQCEKDKRRGYNPAIFRPGTFYAATGREDFIGFEDAMKEERDLN